jgi:biotin carboxyl carrier protein
MPILVVEGKKYRVGDLAGEEPFLTVPVDEQNVGLELLRQSSIPPTTVFVRAGSRVIGVSVQRHDDHRVYFVEVNGRPLTVTLEEDASFGENRETTVMDGPALVNSPMAGKIASIKTPVDSKVVEGQSLMILEAMKMQNEIASPKTGVVRELYVKQGDLVKAGDRLCLVGDEGSG